jgi:hypothetical protein
MDTNGFVFLKLRQESATSGRHSLVGATRLGRRPSTPHRGCFRVAFIVVVKGEATQNGSAPDKSKARAYVQPE